MKMILNPSTCEDADASYAGSDVCSARSWRNTANRVHCKHLSLWQSGFDRSDLKAGSLKATGLLNEVQDRLECKTNNYKNNSCSRIFYGLKTLNWTKKPLKKSALNDAKQLPSSSTALKRTKSSLEQRN